MFRTFPGIMVQVARLLGRPTPQLDRAELIQFVRQLLDQRQQFLALSRDYGSPLYVVDPQTLLDRARQFRQAFADVLPKIKVFYAVKCNNHPLFISALARNGFGLDVSSGLELALALDCNARQILFSGPGKTDAELEMAVQHAGHVTVLLDSFAELDKLERIAGKHNVRIRAGIRVTTVESGIWRKFGIPLDQLPTFFAGARGCRHVHLCGIQFHLSWNLNARAHERFIARLGAVLREFKPRHRERIEFIDIGGGYWPPQGEWLQAEATPEGKLRQALGRPSANNRRHYRLPALSITEFAGQIARALRRHLPEEMQHTVYTEPGRWLCNDAMHILLRVLDRKSDSLVITDGGINAVGWERFEHDYFPIINLSRPELAERECLVAGSLCTPHDIWGYSYFGSDIQPGDVLLVPFQGAYTYSLKQEFIKPLPRSVELASAAAVSSRDILVAGTGEG